MQEDEKRVVVPFEEKEAFIPDEEPRREKRICGMTMKILTIILLIIIACAAAIAIAVPLGLKHIQQA